MIVASVLPGACGRPRSGRASGRRRGADRVGELLRRLVALVGVLGERLAHDGIHHRQHLHVERDGGSGSSSSTLCIVVVDEPENGRSPVRN